MNDREIYAKTEAGREEMRTRALHLSGALRTVLLLVDGHRHVSQLLELMSGGKAPADSLEQLLRMGLIELQSAAQPDAQAAFTPAAAASSAASAANTRSPIPAARAAPPNVAAPAAMPLASSRAPLATDGAGRFNQLYAIMNEIVSDYLGLRGYFMQLKIEKCSSSEELLALQQELGAALAKAHGQAVAAELISRIEAAA